VHEPSALPLASRQEQSLRIKQAPDIGEPVAIRVIDAHVRYGAIKALQGVSVDILRGQLTALVGANGAGKSTLLHAIAGLVPLSSGRIEAPVGHIITEVPSHVRVRRLGIALVLEGRGILTQMTVEENLLMGLRIGVARRNLSLEERAARLDEVLALFPALGQRAKLGAGLLSGGEQQMLAIARALLMEPDVLLVDEPTTGLAPVLLREIFASIRKLLESRALTVFLVEQNTDVALQLSSSAYVLERGHIVLSGNAAEVARDPRLRSAYLSG